MSKSKAEQVIDRLDELEPNENEIYELAGELAEELDPKEVVDHFGDCVEVLRQEAIYFIENSDTDDLKEFLNDFKSDWEEEIYEKRREKK